MRTAKFWKVSTVLLAATLAAVLLAEPRKGEPRPNENTLALLKRMFPGCQITMLNPDKDDGEQRFDVRLEDPERKQNILATISDSGEVLELDEDMELREIPPHIEKAFRKAFPDAQLLHLEKGTKMEISYRLDIKQGDRKHEVKISRRGRIFEVESRK